MVGTEHFRDAPVWVKRSPLAAKTPTAARRRSTRPRASGFAPVTSASSSAVRGVSSSASATLNLATEARQCPTKRPPSAPVSVSKGPRLSIHRGMVAMITRRHGTPPIVRRPAGRSRRHPRLCRRLRPGVAVSAARRLQVRAESSRSTLPSPSPSICANMAAAVSSVMLPPPSTSRSFLNSLVLMNPSWSVSISSQVGAYCRRPPCRLPLPRCSSLHWREKRRGLYPARCGGTSEAAIDRLCSGPESGRGGRTAVPPAKLPASYSGCLFAASEPSSTSFGSPAQDRRRECPPPRSVLLTQLLTRPPGTTST